MCDIIPCQASIGGLSVAVRRRDQHTEGICGWSTSGNQIWSHFRNSERSNPKPFLYEAMVNTHGS